MATLVFPRRDAAGAPQTETPVPAPTPVVLPLLRRPAALPAHEDCFGISFHGEVAILTPTGAVEKLPWEFIESAADAVLPPLLRRQPPMVVVDLGELEYCGSVFLSLLLRIERSLRRRHGNMALCGIGPQARELLRITNLDTLWAIYESREEAVEALEAE